MFKRSMTMILLAVILAMVAAQCQVAVPAQQAGTEVETAEVEQDVEESGEVAEAEMAEAEEAAEGGQPICSKEEIVVVNSMREIAQPYHANLDKGGRLFAEWAGLNEDQYVLQLNQGDSDKQVSLMKSLLATKPECTVFNVEPNADLVVIPMVETADQTGSWVVTHWAHPEGFHPFDGHNQWIAHVGVNSLDAGIAISEELINAMGGQGNIVALQGRLDTDPAQKRFAGLQQVLESNPDVKLLDDQTANWDRTEAFPIAETWLTQYGDEIDGIWAANDDMALGAIEALRAAGLAGEIPVVGVDGIPEAIEAIAQGEMIATSSSDAYYQGSIGLAMGLCVMTGQVERPENWPNENRDFYLKLLTINASNAEQFLGDPDPEMYYPEWECDNLMNRNVGPAF